MEKNIDIHSHILPGIDDGSDSMEMSMEMLRMAAKDGIGQMILTPHNKPWHSHTDYAGIAAKVERLQHRLTEERLDMKLYAGSELYYRSGLVDELDQGMAVTLANSHYVLVEFEPSADYDYIRNGMYALVTGGYDPIIAHAERYKNICSKTARIAELAKMGCFIQVNAGSIMGRYGFGVKQITRNMLKQGLVHFVATDAHDLDRRQPCLSLCADYIRKKYGQDSARRLFYEHPMCVLHDEYIEGRKDN